MISHKLFYSFFFYLSIYIYIINGRYEVDFYTKRYKLLCIFFNIIFFKFIIIIIIYIYICSDSKIIVNSILYIRGSYSIHHTGITHGTTIAVVCWIARLPGLPDCSLDCWIAGSIANYCAIIIIINTSYKYTTISSYNSLHPIKASW